MQKIKSIEKAMEIIIYLSRQGVPKALTEISEDLKIGKSTVHRILKTLESGLFIQQDENNKYSLGVKFYLIGMTVSLDNTFLQVIKPYVKKLYEEFHEVINVSVLDQANTKEYFSMVFHKEQNSQRVIAVTPQIGRRIECYCSSVGKCLLAFSKGIDISRYKTLEFKSYTENTINSYEELVKEIAKIQELGYAIDDQEQESDLFCIGVPILDNRGHALAAMSVSGIKSFILSHGKENIVSALLDTSAQITRALYK